MARNGSSVRPKKWTNPINIYDDGVYSAVWGDYEEVPDKKCLGVRWNGADDDADDIGYPGLGGNPTWFVEPDHLTETILLDLREKVRKNPSHGNLNNISAALDECESWD
ncbi:MAG: hypothetical protein LBL06_01300 [Treponema sp.]|jgi:hypothetical protein|nr:hypothetical protein [Treponema sp.]